MAISITITHEGQLSPNTITDNPQELENCNMFSIDALNSALTYMTIRNYWSLYDIQKRKFNVRKFDVRFSEFTQEFRLQTETQDRMYSKRYVYYAPIQFIDYQKRQSYKRSIVYNKTVGYKEISDHPDIYTKNFMLFVNGNIVSTAEILPLEDKTAIIIDVASSQDKDGIPPKDYQKFREDDAIVTILFIPNYTYSRLITNRYAMNDNDLILNFSKFSQDQNIKSNGVMLINSHDPTTSSVAFRRPTTKYQFDMINRKCIFDEGIFMEFEDEGVSESIDMIKNYDFLILNFDASFHKLTVNNKGYFKLSGKMPCPVENMVVFCIPKNGGIFYDPGLTIDVYYPNIYRINSIHETDMESYLVYYFFDDTNCSENEEYFNQISLYEKYVDLFNQYTKDNNVPDILKEWQPSEIHYSENDYQGTFQHFHSPTPLVYKIFKMFDMLSKDQWSLNAYLKFLLCPSEKYYIDVTKTSLTSRIRSDTSQEPLHNETYVFQTLHYVFAMNRRYLKQSRYAFRIWVDGNFIREEQYHIEVGLDYYYIYIPCDLVMNKSMIEIERHKLFDFHRDYTFENMEDYIELLFDGDLANIYAHDIFVVDKHTNQYIDQKLFRMRIYSDVLQRWEDIDPTSFALLNNRTVRIYPRRSSFINSPIMIGVYKGADMYSSEIYNKDDYSLGDWVYVETTNNGNYKSSDYRVFNKGRLVLPTQWQSDWANTYGGTDSCRTNWILTKGDQITVDHVPCSFRTVHYQSSIPKSGLVDLDGKLNLPINLKWYDIYLNGKKLHCNNIEIVSPTKFYIKEVKSRKHLIIFDRNRDNDAFYLFRHDTKYLYDLDHNDTLIDKLFRAGLQDIIDSDKDPITDDEPDIGEPGVFGPGVLDGIVYFILYLRFSYINCNYKLIPAKVKRKFKLLINPDGSMGINANTYPDGILYKVINCNKGVGGMDKYLSQESIDTGLRELKDRFALTPLHSHNYLYALKGEFLCDPETGGTGIRHNDGTITMIDELNRKKEHIDLFEQKLILANIGRYSIFDAQFDDDSRVKVYYRGANLLDNEIMIQRYNGEPIGKVAFSIDVTVLQKPTGSDILRWSNHDPVVVIRYYTQRNHQELREHRQVASRLGDRYIEVDSDVLVITSIVLDLPSNAISEDVPNPDVEDGDTIPILKGVTITSDNYKDPELPENNGDSLTTITGSPVEGEECVCPEDTQGDESDPGEIRPPVTQDPIKDTPDYNDDELYNPIGPVDTDELINPMRCIVHSILIALKEGDLLL